MPYAKNINTFRELLAEATKNIESIYFQLPIASCKKPIYRERVYCYELYHQLRKIWPLELPFLLGGKVDKSGHPFFVNGLQKIKPDFLVHQPGSMSGNLVVLEVKPINAREDKIKKDITNITALVQSAQYKQGMYLIYGGTKREIENFRRNIEALAKGDARERIDLSS